MYWDLELSRKEALIDTLPYLSSMILGCQKFSNEHFLHVFNPLLLPFSVTHDLPG